jgi:hypothetical protein
LGKRECSLGPSSFVAVNVYIPKSASFEHMKSVEPRRILFFMFEPALFRRGAFPAKKEEDA